MKKLFKYCVLTLSLVLLLMQLVSCSPTDDTVDNTDNQTEAVLNVPYNISEYVVIRPEQTVEEVINSGVTLRKHINTLLGENLVKITDDWIKGGVVTEEISAAKEILVGNTTRPESEQALEGVDPTSFVIKVIAESEKQNKAHHCEYRPFVRPKDWPYREKALLPLSGMSCEGDS